MESYEDWKGTEEELFQVYLDYCKKHGQKPDLSDFKVWLDENYA